MQYEIEIKANLDLKWYQIPALFLLDIACRWLGFEVRHDNRN